MKNTAQVNLLDEIYIDGFCGGGGWSVGFEFAVGRPVDIHMRMVAERELYNAQGFPVDYIIDFDVNGKPYPKAEKVKRVGNSVNPQIATALTRANMPEVCVFDINAMAMLNKRIAV